MTKLRFQMSAMGAAVLLLLTGCASGDDGGAEPQAAATPSHNHTPGMDMSDMDMSDDGSGPSDDAKMICSKEIRDSVQKILGLEQLPTPEDSWEDLTYTCTYKVPAGTLVMTVEDSPDVASGKKFFNALRDRTEGASPFAGMEALGLPSFQTEGTAVFLKDGKTLQVDATQIETSAGPDKNTKIDVAYAAAAAVVACWVE